MFCCTDCNIQTQSTITTVIFVDQSYNQVQNKLQQYAQKHQKRMYIKKKQQTQPELQNNKENIMHLNLNQKYSSHIDVPTKRNFKDQKPNMNFQNDKNEQTNRMRNKLQTPKNSRVSKNMESKTTSFSSLASRPSNSDFYRAREVNLLKNELEKLKHEQNILLKSKLQKQFVYKEQWSKINKKREELKKNSEQRQIDLVQLKKLLLKHKNN